MAVVNAVTPTALQNADVPTRCASAPATASGAGRNSELTACEDVSPTQIANSATTTASWIARTREVWRSAAALAGASIARLAHCIDRGPDLVAQQFVALVADLREVRLQHEIGRARVRLA